MTRENRASDRMCPDCNNNPVLEADGDAFCDICNRYMETTMLVS